MIVCIKKTISTALSTLITLDGIAEVKQRSLLSSLRENGHSHATANIRINLSSMYDVC